MQCVTFGVVVRRLDGMRRARDSGQASRVRHAEGLYMAAFGTFAPLASESQHRAVRTVARSLIARPS